MDYRFVGLRATSLADYGYVELLHTPTVPPTYALLARRDAPPRRVDPGAARAENRSQLGLVPGVTCDVPESFQELGVTGVCVCVQGVTCVVAHVPELFPICWGPPLGLTKFGPLLIGLARFWAGVNQSWLGEVWAEARVGPTWGKSAQRETKFEVGLTSFGSSLDRLWAGFTQVGVGFDHIFAKFYRIGAKTNSGPMLTTFGRKSAKDALYLAKFRLASGGARPRARKDDWTRRVIARHSAALHRISVIVVDLETGSKLE